jgi:hypothetical protein
MAYMFADMDGDTPVMITITSQSLGKIKDQWFRDAAEFIGSARKY